jgi:hypothetical protein
VTTTHEPAHDEPPHHEPDYAVATDSLAARFEGVFTREEVSAAVADARAQLEPGSRIHDFLELLVERRARDLLQSRVTAGRPESAVPTTGRRQG